MGSFNPGKIINLLSESNLQGIAIYSSYRFVYSNKKTLDLLGISQEEFSSLDLDGFRKRILSEDVRDNEHFFEQFDGTSMVDSKTIFRYKGNNSLKWIEMFAKSAVLDGNRYVMLIMSDITEHKVFEELVSDKEFKYRNFLEQTSEGISLMEFEKPIDTTLPIDRQIELIYKYGIISECNLALAKMYGLENVKEITGKRLIDLHGSSDNPKNIEAFERLAKDGYKTANVETEELDTHGKRKYFLNNSVGILKGNLLYGIWGAQIDITLRKISEKLITAAYRISEAVHLSKDLNSMYETIHGIINGFMYAGNFYIAVYDRKDDMISFPYFRDEFDGTAKSRKPGKGITEFVIKTGTPLLATREIVDRMKENGDILPFGTTAVDWLGVPLKTGDETIGVLAVQSYDDKIRFTDDDVNVLEFVSDQIAMAIERKKAEEALILSENKNRAILSSMPDLMFILTKDGVFTDYHAKDINDLYLKPEEFIGKNISEVFGEPLISLFKKTIKDAYVESAVQLCEYPMELRGEIKNFEARMISYGEGNMLVMIRDITDRIKIMDELIVAKNKAEEMNMIKSNFLSNMSHELRTPLHGILGFSQILEDDIPDADLKNMASTIHSSGKRLLETLNQLLNFSKSEAKKIDVNYSDIDMNALLSELAGSYKAYARSKGIELAFNEPGSQVKARLDERLLRDILNNLINNAIKFTDKGGVYIGLMSEDKNVAISVKDTGIGIPENKYEVIFEEFRQESEGLNRNFEGTGLGLTLTRKYTELMKGHIYVKSIPGSGSEFTVVLPLNPETETVKAEKPGDKEPGAEKINLPSGKRSILIVENDRGSTLLMKTYLSKIFDIDAVVNGADALKNAAKKQYDLILMDINLGEGLNGIEATQLIRKMENYKNIPIVAVTAFALDSDREDFLRHGCSHYISKPFEQNELLSLLQEIFSSSNTK